VLDHAAGKRRHDTLQPVSPTLMTHLQHGRDGQMLAGPVRVGYPPCRGFQRDRVDLDVAFGAGDGPVEQPDQLGWAASVLITA
jgi:hypothetical protein